MVYMLTLGVDGLYSWEPFQSEKALSFGSMAPVFCFRRSQAGRRASGFTGWESRFIKIPHLMIPLAATHQCLNTKNDKVQHDQQLPRVKAQAVSIYMYVHDIQTNLHIRLSLDIFTIVMFVHTLHKYVCYVCYVIVFQHQRTVHTIAALCRWHREPYSWKTSSLLYHTPIEKTKNIILLTLPKFHEEQANHDRVKVM